ncbi:MAG: four-carbon acid sugar kinase family protein [Cyanobacteriota bacterium]|nr:four-carbon acid sugar kinase family protein [Cyanobacteriota bacterium]
MKIVVIDDDPTGSQTVHGCPLLLRWDAATLDAGLDHPSPLLFVLANTRALAPADARARVRQIAAGLAAALERARRRGSVDHWLLVSRGDSTLRGHFPLEVEELDAVLGPFDATLLVPAFLEGGRTTVDGVHRLHGRPVHESPFARDALFGYRSSDLPTWVEERSGGRLPAAAVRRLGLAALEGDGAALRRWLGSLSGNPVVAVDAERPQHLQALAAAVRDLVAPVSTASAIGVRPRRFLAQSAAGLPAALAALPPQPRDAAGLAALRRTAADGTPLPGLVLVGSHVPLTDAQLERLLADPGCGGVELPVARLLRVLDGPLPDRLLASLEAAWLGELEAVLAAGHTPVLFTSRGEVQGRHAAERRALGLALAGLMARIGAALAPRLGYLISKGGITTHTLLADGLGLERVELQGQLLPGLSLVLAPAPPAAALPVITFPGNLGEADSLHQAWAWMERGRPDPL